MPRGPLRNLICGNAGVSTLPKAKTHVIYSRELTRAVRFLTLKNRFSHSKTVLLCSRKLQARERVFPNQNKPRRWQAAPTKTTTMATMAMPRLAILLVLATTLPLSLATSQQIVGVTSQARETLVVVESDAMIKTHALFLKSLEDRAAKYGGAVSVRTKDAIASSSGIGLRRWDRWAYDSLVLLAPTAEEIGGETLTTVVSDFVISGRSVFLAGSETMSQETRDLAKSLGVAFHDSILDSGANALVTDHFANRDGDHETVEATTFLESDESVLAAGVAASGLPLAYRGVGQSLVDDADSGLAFSAARAPATSYCPTKKGFVSKKKGLKKFTGEDISLVSLVQARNNARVAVTGSLAMLADDWLGEEAATANAALARDVTAWVLGYKSLLRLARFDHYEAATMATKDVYRIKDDLRVAMALEEWSAEAQDWVPFKTKDEIQVELTMLDPHVRKTFAVDKTVRRQSIPPVHPLHHSPPQNEREKEIEKMRMSENE